MGVVTRTVPADLAQSSIHAGDLDFLASLAMRRGVTPAAERRRLDAVRSLLAAASEVNRSLAIFLKHALVHCQGSPGCSDLSADTRAVAEALGHLSAGFDRTSAEPGLQCEGHLS